MKMEDVAKAVDLDFERKDICNMLELIEANHNHNLQIGVATTYVCHSNSSRTTSSSRVIDRFREALKQALNEVDKEIELL